MFDWQEEEIEAGSRKHAERAKSAGKFMSKKAREKAEEDIRNKELQTEEMAMKAVVEKRKEFMESQGRSCYDSGRTEVKKERSRSKEKSNPSGSNPTGMAKDEQEAIKANYINSGAVEKKKPLRKPAEKRRNDFKFEWDASEDTSKDINPLYNQRKGYVPIFGKGMLGGVDAADQEREVDKYIKAVEKFQDKISTETCGGKAENINKPKLVNRYTRIEAEGKNMYKRPEDMSERDWKIFRENNDIRVISGKSVAPIREFGDGDLNLRIVKNIEAIGYKKPTPIQMQGITMGLARKDMIGLAPTGSGKSAAFLIPMIHYLIPLTKLTRDRPDEGPHGIVLSPTRELTMQIQEEFQKLTVGLGMKSALLIGGHDSNDQEDLINFGVDVIFATPGRLHDLLNKSLISLDRCNYVVIDEADLMIDLGLEEDLHEILSTIPRSNLKSTIPELAAQQEIQAAKRHDPFRTTHMFSATMPRSLRSIAQKYLRNECFVSIGEPGEGNKNIKHEIVLTGEQSRKTQLLRWIDNSSDQTLVFCNSQYEVEAVGKYLQGERISVGMYHGGKSQFERENMIERFKQNKFKVLVATDLASRGLDVEGVRMVINYDCPKTIENYVHRAGRTGRAGNKGTAVTFITSGDEGLFYDLVTYLKANGQSIPRELEEHPAAAAKIKPTDQNQEAPGNEEKKVPIQFEGSMVQRSSYY